MTTRADTTKVREALEYYASAPWAERPGDWSNTNYAQKAEEALAALNSAAQEDAGPVAWRGETERRRAAVGELIALGWKWDGSAWQKPYQSGPVAKGLAVNAAIVEVRNAQLFEDGVEADLHAAGVVDVANAYATGREDALNELASLLRERSLLADPAPVAIPDEISCSGYAASELRQGYVEGWNACRAAMLAAAPVPSAHDAEGKWLPIESAPKSGLFFGWSETGQHEIVDGATYWQSVAADAKPYMPIAECRALTHWQPLPAPPSTNKGQT